jgi:hypothetical protein
MISFPNHRDLVRSSEKMVSFHFCRLPHDLQDVIIDGLESNAITLYDASAMAMAAGFPLSREAISGYCGFVRQLRRKFIAMHDYAC